MSEPKTKLRRFLSKEELDLLTIINEIDFVVTGGTIDSSGNTYVSRKECVKDCDVIVLLRKRRVGNE